MKTLLITSLVLLALFFSSCRDEEYPDKMICEIKGQVQIRDLNTPAYIDPANPPTVVLLEKYYYKPWSSTLNTKQKTVVDKNGWFTFTTELVKGVEYCLDIGNYDTAKYCNLAKPWLSYEPIQTVHYPLVAISWAIPRFINSVNLPDDTFKYSHGIGIIEGPLPVFVGATDTIMPWVYRTWGGTDIGQNNHYVVGTLIRNGVGKYTKIYYTVPPGDTSIIEIRY